MTLTINSSLSKTGPSGASGSSGTNGTSASHNAGNGSSGTNGSAAIFTVQNQLFTGDAGGDTVNFSRSATGGSGGSGGLGGAGAGPGRGLRPRSPIPADRASPRPMSAMMHLALQAWAGWQASPGRPPSATTP